MNAASKNQSTFAELARGRGRQVLLSTTVMSAALLGLTLHSQRVEAACTGSNPYSCAGSLNQTLTTTNNADTITATGASNKLTINSLGDNDSISITSSTFQAKSNGNLVDAGEGNDIVTVTSSSLGIGDLKGNSGDDSITLNGSSLSGGDIRGGSGSDTLVVKGASTVTGNVDGGIDGDLIYVIEESNVTGSVLGGGSADTIVIDKSKVGTNVEGEAGEDIITVGNASTVDGSVLGGNDADTILVEGASTVKGNFEGGGGADDIRVRGASKVLGSVVGDQGDDIIVISEASEITGDVSSGNGGDKVTIQGASKVGGGVLGGGDADVLLVEGSSSVTGNLEGAGGSDDIRVSTGSTVTGSVLGQQGDDVIVVSGASTVTTDVDGGGGYNLVTIQGASKVSGNVLGGGDTDSIVIEGGSEVLGDVDSANGADTIMVRESSHVASSVVGGKDDDQISILDGATIDGSVYGDTGLDQQQEGEDKIIVDGTVAHVTTIKGDVDGGRKADVIEIGLNSQASGLVIEGSLLGGNGADTITVAAGDVQGGISAGAGQDTVNLIGGVVDGFDGGNTIEMGDGNDTLNVNNSDPASKQALDISDIIVFNGGDDGGQGENMDIATLTGLNGSYVEGGLFDRNFVSWDVVNVVDSYLELDGTPTISTLNLNTGSILYQTDGVLGILDENSEDKATLAVDATSFIEMRDEAFVSGNVPSAPTLVPGGGAVIQAEANDSISVANLTLVGGVDPYVNTSLGIDFDADDTQDQNGRDSAAAGNADQIDVSTGISLTGVVGIDINAYGGYLGSGLPLSLSGSVAVIDDLTAAPLANPGINADLATSTNYVTDDLVIDPARRIALVDQGTNGVFLQWTTPIDNQTMAPNAEADLAVAIGSNEVLLGVSDGLLDGNLLRRDICVQPTADAPGNDQCDRTGFSIWAQTGGSHTDLGNVDGFASFDTGNWWFAGGADYAVNSNWKLGVFGAYETASADLGSVNGSLGERSSDADISAGYGGGYVLARYDVFYLAGVGMLGQSRTDLKNGVLLNAKSDYDSFVGAVSGSAGAVFDIGSSIALDPRVQLTYVNTNSDDYKDSYGLDLDSATDYTRVAATMGLLYNPSESALSVAARAGAAFVSYDTKVNASDSSSKTSADVNLDREVTVFTASLDANWHLQDNLMFTGALSGDAGDDIAVLRGSLGLTYQF